jgi:S1-C subfamily serine protease
VPVDARGGGLAGMTVGDVLLGHPAFGDLRGAQVLTLSAVSPAHAAGFEVGDIITAVDEAKVRSAAELIWRLSRAGNEFRVTLSRDGQPAFLKSRK